MGKKGQLRVPFLYLWNGQSLHLLRPLLRVGAGLRVGRNARSVQGLQADLGAEEIADSFQGAAGVGRQRGVGQQV